VSRTPTKPAAPSKPDAAAPRLTSAIWRPSAATTRTASRLLYESRKGMSRSERCPSSGLAVNPWKRAMPRRAALVPPRKDSTRSALLVTIWVCAARMPLSRVAWLICIILRLETTSGPTPTSSSTASNS